MLTCSRSPQPTNCRSIGVDLEVNLQDDVKTYPYKQCYPLSATEDKVLREYIEENLGPGFLAESRSPMGAPILFVKKKDGTLRLCVDYRGLNNITKREPYPLPVISNVLRQLSGAKIMSKIDLRGAYNVIRVKAGDEWKTAFNCKYGHFEYRVMPFGLKNAPAAFQRFMNEIFREYRDHFVVVYLNDILIYSSDPSQHDEHVRLDLSKLREHGLASKLDKCAFDVEEVEVLGYVVSSCGVSMDPVKAAAIRDWKVPVSTRAVQAFLGFVNFYREFIVDYAKLARPLHDCTRKNVLFAWTPECTASFHPIKDAVASAPILVHFLPEQPCVLETDASDFAIGLVLSQPQANGVLHPVAFHSRKLSPQRSTTRRMTRSSWRSWTRSYDGDTTWRATLTRSASSPTIRTCSTSPVRRS